MLFFLVFLPYMTLAALSWVVSVAASLLAAAAVAGALLLRDRLAGRSPKLITLTSAVMFVCLGVLLLTYPAISTLTVRTALDAGLLVMTLGALALGFPFTLQYAREQAAPDAVGRPEFIRTNYVLTVAWIGAFALMLVADIASLWWPSAPLWAAVAVAFAVRNSTVHFTKWYTRRARERLLAVQTAAPTHT